MGKKTDKDHTLFKPPDASRYTRLSVDQTLASPPILRHLLNLSWRQVAFLENDPFNSLLVSYFSLPVNRI